MTWKKRSLFSRILRFLLALTIGCMLLSAIAVLSLRWINPPITAFMVGDRIAAWQSNNSYPLRREWVEWSKISAAMKIAVIAAEDQTFASHHGFDLQSINDALEERDSKRRVRGASTITQQVAKNLFLWGGKRWVRKGLEAWFTVLIEVLWPKSRILEMHLNIAQFGRGLYGVGAAAKIYFRKPAEQLNANEAALLAAVLPNPIKLRADSPSRYVKSRQQWILTQMKRVKGL
jgi:monofunctional biosynthetic peptidoglycan transglycosylase